MFRALIHAMAIEMRKVPSCTLYKRCGNETKNMSWFDFSSRQFGSNYPPRQLKRNMREEIERCTSKLRTIAEETVCRSPKVKDITVHVDGEAKASPVEKEMV